MLEDVRKTQFGKEKMSVCQCLIIVPKNLNCREEQQIISLAISAGLSTINTYDLMSLAS